MTSDSTSIEKAMQADGFVNFYSLLGLSPETPDEQLQESINAMYQDAQTHRDHRVPARRRESQLLLETLPQARTILLDASRRKRYNAYCNAVEMESPRIPYPEFLSGLLHTKAAPDARADILTVRDLSRLRMTAPEMPVETPLSIENTPQTASDPVGEAPAESEEPLISATTIPAPEMPDSGAVSQSWLSRFPLPSLGGGAIVLAGMMVCLPALAGVPLLLTMPLACLSAGVTAYVFAIPAHEVSA